MVNKIEIIKADLADPVHCKNIIVLLNEYMVDEMGGGDEIVENDKAKEVIDGLRSIDGTRVFLAKENNQFVGMAICFIGFSTFKRKKLINIHDLIVLKSHRLQGIARKLLEYIHRFAADNNFCKITLEVREDNFYARALYKSQGFTECDPPMDFWIRNIEP